MIIFQLFYLGNLVDIIIIVLVLCMYYKLSLAASPVGPPLYSSVLRFIQLGVVCPSATTTASGGVAIYVKSMTSSLVGA